MQKIERVHLYQHISKKLSVNPVVALLGPRQVGKSTIAKDLLKNEENGVYLDLEKPSDRSKLLNDPELFFRVNKNKLICLDEIQFAPEIFKVMRSYIDENEARPKQFLILGSASRELLKQSGETLAGRISYLEISSFIREEIASQNIDLNTYWLRGGYPRSLLSIDEETSYDWRQDYIQSFLVRDLASLGFSIPAEKIERLWSMIAHHHGSLLNLSLLSKSLGVSDMTIKSYLEILEKTFMIRLLKPFHTNEKKRLIKSPKVYIRDTGILHALLKIENMNDLLGHPVVGNSFESLVIENVIQKFPRWEPFFYRDSSNNEIDLVLVKGSRKIVVEIKSSTSPKAGKGFWNSIKFLKPDSKWLIGHVESSYKGKEDLTYTSLDSFLEKAEI